MTKPIESEKSEKKKLIRVGIHTDHETSYEYTNMNFAFVSSPENGRMQCGKPMSCRENVSRAVSDSMINQKSGSPLPPIDLEKLRLLLVKNIKEDHDGFKTRLFSGKALLNRYEEKAGWEPSKITTVKHKCYKNVWLLTGPKEWMSQPQLLSIATIFMRIMSIHGPLEVDTFEQAENCLEALYSDYINRKNNIEQGESFTYYPDIESYLKHLKDIKILVTHAKEIFANMGIEKAWANDHNENFNVQSGLLSFLNPIKLKYNKDVSSAQDRFAKLRKKLIK